MPSTPPALPLVRGPWLTVRVTQLVLRKSHVPRGSSPSWVTSSSFSFLCCPHLQPVSPPFCSSGLEPPSPRHSSTHTPAPFPVSLLLAFSLPVCPPSRACTDRSPGTNPIRKSSRWLRVMRRPRKPRRSWKPRGLKSSTKAKNSSQQPETHNQGAGQLCQAMLGAGPGPGGVACVARRRPRLPGPKCGEAGLLAPARYGVRGHLAPPTTSRSNPASRQLWPGTRCESPA